MSAESVNGRSFVLEEAAARMQLGVNTDVLEAPQLAASSAGLCALYELHLLMCRVGPEETNVTLHFHNDEHRSPVHRGKAFGHFSCSHPGLRIAKLIEDMQLTGASSSLPCCSAEQCGPVNIAQL